MPAVLGRQAPPGLPTDPEYYTWSIQGQLTAIDLAFMLIALIAVLGRLYIRLFVLRLFRVDDYFIVLAMIFSILGCSIFLYVVHLGMGKHIFAIPGENIEPLLMWIFIVSVLIPLALMFAKFSIAFFLLSLTRGTRYGKFCWVIIVFLTVFLLFTFFTLIFGCVPISANWHFALRPPPVGTGNARCMTLNTYRNIAFVNSITNIVTDIVLAVMPIPLIWRLQVNKRTKASLIFILGLGFFACAAGIVKTPLLFHFFDDFDSTGHRAPYYAWQMIEMNTAILAATLPSLKPAFRWLIDSARALSTRGGASGGRTRTSIASPVVGYKRHFSSGYLRQRDLVGSGSGSMGSEPGGRMYDGTAASTAGMSMGGYSYALGKIDTQHGALGRVVELQDLNRQRPACMPMYNVTVEGAGTTAATAAANASPVSASDEKTDGSGSAGGSGLGRGSNASSDAILRIEDVDGVGVLPVPVYVPPGERGIFRTTEVTVVTT